MRRTESTTIRLQGNALVAESNNESLSICLRRYKLTDALKLYEKARAVSRSNDDTCSAVKNIATASRKLALSIEKNDEEKLGRKHYYFTEAIKHFDEAYGFSECKSLEWQDALLASLRGAVEEALEDLLELQFKDRIRALHMYIGVANNVKIIKAELNLELLKQRFHQGIRYVQEKDFKSCLNEMHECYTPLEEASKHGKGHEHIESEVRIFRQDTYVYRCISEASRVKATADELFAEGMFEQEELELDLVWEVIDLYIEATLLTRDRDLELEAASLSMVGQIYDKVLRMKNKATKYFKMAIQLAMSLTPRKFDTADWYKISEDTLRRYQEEKLKEESLRWENQRIPIVAELEEELKLIEKASKKGAIPFLKYIYGKYPPKGKHTAPDFSAIENNEDGDYAATKLLQKMVKKALVHYHDDKVSMEEHGGRWKVLCEEISKCVGAFHQHCKNMD